MERILERPFSNQKCNVDHPAIRWYCKPLKL